MPCQSSVLRQVRPRREFCAPGPALLQAQTQPFCVQVENEELRHLLWSSVVFYQTPGLEVTACVLLSTKAVYFVLHDGLRRYFSEPLQGRRRGLLAPGSRARAQGDRPRGLRQQGSGCAGLRLPCLGKGLDKHSLSWSCQERAEASTGQGPGTGRDGERVGQPLSRGTPAGAVAGVLS